MAFLGNRVWIGGFPRIPPVDDSVPRMDFSVVNNSQYVPLI